IEPVAKDRGRSSAGCCVRPKRTLGQFDTQRGSAFGVGAPFEASEACCGLGVEITGRDGRIKVALAGKEAGDVAQIFPLQRQRLIFGMSLKEDEVAAKLLGEDIDTALRRLRQQL